MIINFLCDSFNNFVMISFFCFILTNKPIITYVIQYNSLLRLWINKSCRVFTTIIIIYNISIVYVCCYIYFRSCVFSIYTITNKNTERIIRRFFIFYLIYIYKYRNSQILFKISGNFYILFVIYIRSLFIKVCMFIYIFY